MAFSSFLDPVLLPLLTSLGSTWFILLIALLVSLATILVYKFTTDQILMKNLKEEIDKINKEMKKNMHDQKKVMSMQKEAFNKQMVMMRHSLNSTLITFLPIIILFGWLRANLNNDIIINFGFFKFGWIGSYIIFAIIFSIVLRKVLKVY